jgi:hypothetical protein
VFLLDFACIRVYHPNTAKRRLPVPASIIRRGYNVKSTIIGDTPRSARMAVAAMFFINGAVLASWVPMIPAVQQNLSLSTGALGIALLGMAAGALLAMPIAGMVSARRGSGMITTLAGLIYCAVLPMLLLAPVLPVLFLVLFVFGAANGAMDVTMNAQGVLVERRYRRPIMSSFHGLYSMGGFTGAVSSGILAALGVPSETRMLGAACLFAIGVAVASRWLLPAAGETTTTGPRFARLSGPLVALAVVGFSAFVAEGAMGDWSAVYLRNSLGAGPALASAGFAAFACTMAAMRMTGDRLVQYAGPVLVVRSGGIIAGIGLGVALLVGHPLAAIIGCGLVGCGMANVVPVMLSAAGRASSLAAGPAIAAVSTGSYFGSLAGPPVVGFAANVVTLPYALGLVVACCLVVTLLAGAVTSVDRAHAGA